MLFKKSKKNIAILLVIAMLLTIMPMTVFAEGEEATDSAFGAELTSTPNETDTTLFNLRADVTSGSHLITTPSSLQVNWVVNGTEEGFTTAGIQNEGDTAFYAQKELTVTGNTTVKAIFNYDGTQFESNEITIEVEAKSGTVNNTMTQEKIQVAIDTNDEIVFEAGTYTDISLMIKGNKTIVPQGTVVFNYTTPKNAINMVEDGSVLTIGDGIGGTLEIAGSGNGIYAINTDVTINFAENVTFYVHDNIMTDGPLSGNGISLNGNFEGSINAGEGVVLKLTNNKAGIYTYGAEPGTQNAPIGFITINFDGCELIDLSNNNGKGNGSGFHQGDGWYVNASLNIEDCKEVKMNNNQTDAVCFDGGADVSNLNIINCQNVEMKANGSWGTNGGDIQIIDSILDISDNSTKPWSDVTYTSSNLCAESLLVENSKIFANNCGANCGIWVQETGMTVINNSEIYADNNGQKCYGAYNHSSRDWYCGDYPWNAGNGFASASPTTTITNSVIYARNNGGSGMAFYNIIDTANGIEPGKAKIENSYIFADSNGLSENVGVKDSLLEEKNRDNRNALKYDSAYYSGIAVIRGELAINDSVVSTVGNKKYGISYHDLFDGKVVINGQTVEKVQQLDSDGVEIYSDKETKKVQETYVLSGSLQGIRDNMTGTYGDTWNTVKGADEIYAAPINNEGTKLTRFDLHNEVNKEVGLQSEQAKWTNKSFTYYDPNNKESKYDYQFRFNKDGEDLVKGESGNAYVWTPASVLHYDATEGTVDTLGTAGEITVGNSTANQTGDNTGLNTRYTQDVTIYGNSLNLAEKTMPTAARTGYVFLGWYVADNEEKAKEYASKGEFENLYNLLNTEFTAPSKVATDLDDVSKGQADKTIYAKWASTLIQGTIFEDGTRNNVLDTNEYVFEKIPVRLMQDGKVVATTETNVDGKYRFDGVDLGKYTVEIDWPKKDNVAMKNICTVNNTEAGNKFNAGTDNAFATSIEIEISEEFREATLNAGFYNTSDGGGGWTPTDPGTDEPTVDIPDPDVPLTEPEEPTIDIEDPDVPLVDVPGETVEIEEPEVPLGDAPATGDRSAAIPFAVLMLIAAAGLAITRKRFN